MITDIQDETLDSLYKDLSSLNRKDIAFLALGAELNFNEAQLMKTEMIAHLTDTLDLTLGQRSQPETYVYKQSKELVAKYLGMLREQVGTAEKAYQDRNSGNTPQRKRALLDEMERTKTQLYKDLQLQRLELRFSATNDMTTEGYTKSIRQVEDEVKRESKRAMDLINDVVKKLTLAKSRKVFDSLVTSHVRHERCWLGVTILMLAVVGVVFYGIAFSPHWFETLSSSQSASDSLASVGRRVILLSVPLLGLRFCLQHYRIERHLRTTYQHHMTIVEQFSTLEELLCKSGESQEAFRAEVVRTILAIPNSGYLAAGNAATEVNLQTLLPQLPAGRQSAS